MVVAYLYSGDDVGAHRVGCHQRAAHRVEPLRAPHTWVDDDRFTLLQSGEVGACVFLCRACVGVCVGVNGARRRTCSLRSLSTWPLNLCGRSPIDVEDEAAAAVSFVAYVSSGSWELCVGSNKLP